MLADTTVQQHKCLLLIENIVLKTKLQEALSLYSPEVTSVCTYTAFTTRLACACSFATIPSLFPLLAHGAEALVMCTLRMHMQVTCRHKKNLFCTKHDLNLRDCGCWSANILQCYCMSRNKYFKDYFQDRILAAVLRSVHAGWLCRNFARARL